MVGNRRSRGSRFFLAQPPQAFRRDVLQAALAYGASDTADATDEAALAERAGYAVQIVEGESSNIKITTAERHRDCGSELCGVSRSTMRADAALTCAGTATIFHRSSKAVRLSSAAWTLASPRGSLGHSDAERRPVMPITDAILGAACLGDIGRPFPGLGYTLEGCVEPGPARACGGGGDCRGYEIVNVDVTVVLEAPKIRDHVDAMREAIARARSASTRSRQRQGQDQRRSGRDRTRRGHRRAPRSRSCANESPFRAKPPPGSCTSANARTALFNWLLARGSGGNLHPPHRGHRRRAVHPRVRGRHRARPSLARPRLERGPRHRRFAATVSTVRAASLLSVRTRKSCWPPTPRTTCFCFGRAARRGSQEAVADRPARALCGVPAGGVARAGGRTNRPRRAARDPVSRARTART